MKQKLKLINFKDQDPKFIEVIVEKTNSSPNKQILKFTYILCQKDVDPNLFSPKNFDTLEIGSELWKKTCFECFFFDERSAKYFEANISPDGKYALMSFEKYRKQNSTQIPINISNLAIKKVQNSVFISFIIKTEFLSPHTIFPTVILDTPTEQLFFAQIHVKAKPDFHVKKL